MHVGGNIDPDLGMPKLIKGDNIRRLGEDELQGAVRLNSHGEIGPKLQRRSLPKRYGCARRRRVPGIAQFSACAGSLSAS